MECSGTFRFSFSSAKEAREAKIALGNEGPKNKRSLSNVMVKGKELVVEISAIDPVALRAAMNSCLRNITIINKISGVLK